MTEVISHFLDDDDVEWRTRPIKFWGVVKGLLGQLSLGQELTKVSIPAELSEPYSGLELTGARNLGNMNHLFELEGCSPLERMLAVIRFYISGIKEETFARKPFNPLLGEVHLCHSHSEEHGLTSLYSEQCEHHPPIAAVHVHNSKYGVTVENNTIFSVKFHGTWAGIYPSGQVRVQIGKEMYIISKVLPDLHIRNILPFSGRRKTIWTDDSVTITCESTGLSVNLHYQEKKSRSYLKGVIRQGLDPDSEATHKFRGYCSGKYTLIDLASGQRTCLLESEPDSLPMEYPSFEDMDPMESIRIWKEVNAAIIANDMPAANHAKTKIEAEQRARRQAGADLQPRFFKKVNGMWTYDGRTQREKEEDQKRREDKEKEKEREKERQGEVEGVRERKGTKARLQGLVRRTSRGGANLPATEDESSSSEEEQKEKRSRGSIKSPKAIVNGMRAKRQSVKVQNEEDSDKEVEDIPDRTTSPCQSGSGPVGFVKNLLNRSKTDANEGELSEEEEEGPERTTSPGPVAFVKNLLSRSNENVVEDKEKDKEREIPERTTSPPAHPHIPSAGVMFMRNLLGRGPTNRPSDPNPTPTGDVAEESEVTSSAYDSI